MFVCLTCGRRVERAEHARSVCPSCTWHAALRPQPSSTVRTTSDNAAVMAARLHELALIVGERLHVGYFEVLEAVARGNTRIYDSEVTRLANRYIGQLEETWDA